MIRAAARALFTLWLTLTLAFLLLRVLPNRAIEAQLVEGGASQAAIAERRAAANLDAPLWEQYVGFFMGLLRGDLGVSLLNGQPVTEVIVRQLPYTLTLAGLAFLLALILALLVGAAAARDDAAGRVGQGYVALGLSVPPYVSGTLALLLTTRLPADAQAQALLPVLPILVLALSTSAAIAQALQTELRRYQAADWVITARAKGLPSLYIFRRHVLQNTLPPVLAVATTQAGFLLGGAAITETLFSRPGVGRVLVDATLRQDYAIVLGVVVWAAAIYTILFLVLEGLYRAADPRIRSAA